MINVKYQGSSGVMVGGKSRQILELRCILIPVFVTNHKKHQQVNLSGTFVEPVSEP